MRKKGGDIDQQTWARSCPIHTANTVEELLDQITKGRVPGYWCGAESYQMTPQLYVTRPMDDEELYPIMGRFVDRLLSYPLGGTAQTHWCDDTPVNVLSAHHISRMLDTARHVHIYRDPRDVVASYADPNQHWAPDDPVLAATWVSGIMKRWFEIRDQLQENQYIEVMYEDLIADQRTHLQQITDFIELEFEEEMMDVTFVDRSVGRYKDEFSAQDLESVSNIVAPIINEYY